eukprot:scaffold108251_cov31-Cyclotella_meneghiniana.AAC.1
MGTNDGVIPVVIAVDNGITDDCSCGGLAYSITEADPWCMVDLGVSTEIDILIIWNKSNCCSERLSNAAVFLGDEHYNTVGQVPDIGDATGMTTIELNAADFVLPSEMPSFLPSSAPQSIQSETPSSHPTVLPSEMPSFLPSSA